MARRHPRCGAGGAGSGGVVEIDGDTASSEGANQKGKRTSANTPPTHGLAGPAMMASARERRGASGAGWAKGRVGR
jgi:hypothetical protein